MKKNLNLKYKIGIDEVGRGPIAGPVCVCAFLVREKHLYNKLTKNKLPKLKDSKKLSKKQREKWFEFLKNQKKEGICDFRVSFVSPEMIDRFGISKCIQKAIDESLEKLTSENQLDFSFKIFLDGGLSAKKEFVYQETIIRGDELYPVISLASIVAKVSRDKVMETFAKKYPEYGFDKNAGYGTKAHYEAIKKSGLTPIHRKSYIH